jgi:anti-sigma factor (TIGR02949 family)
MTCAQAQDLITALIDQELGQAERSSLEEHLSECSGCRLAFEAESALKQKIREAARGINAPGHLRSRILSDPRIFPEKRRSARRWQDYLRPMPPPLLRPILAFALLLAIALPVFYFSQPRSEPIALAALETYDRFLRGELPVQRTENADEIVGQLTRAVGGHFHPMGYDLTAMNLRPVAGLVREINGRKILVAIYQGQGGTLFCYTFLGSEEDAPTDAARFFEAAKKMNFYAFSRGRVNAVLHREGKVICILASEMPMEELLALAKSKATPS